MYQSRWKRDKLAQEQTPLWKLVAIVTPIMAVVVVLLAWIMPH
jgi:hypothetical protein